MRYLMQLWRRGGSAQRLLLLQAGGYLALELVGLICTFLMPLRWWHPAGILSFYPDWEGLLYSPWRLFTYILPHQHLLHLLLNLGLLAYLAPMVERYFGSRQLVKLYLLGALGGSLCYLLGYYVLAWSGASILPLGLRGCSSAILACLVAQLVQPWGKVFKQGVLSLGLVLGALVLLSLGSFTTNLGGLLAHLGGVTVGLVYGLWYRHTGRHASSPSMTRRDDMAIRRKLRHSGYASLSQQEREHLRRSQHPAP